MPAHPLDPGVPAAGHISSRGYWHPGRIDGCVKCPDQRLPRVDPRYATPQFDTPNRCAYCGSKGEHLLGCGNPTLYR